MPDIPYEPSLVTLSLSSKEHWTLHHVLLDRIELETTTAEPSHVDPPPVEVFRAFETLDAGATSFTLAQLEAIRPILAEYHHALAWERDRPQLEHLLHRVTDTLEKQQTTLTTD